MKHRSVTQTKDVLKIVAEEWRNLSDRDRAFWDEEARNDKVRYVREKAEYKGPWNLPKRRAKKHPMAPKRPMSAFLKFSQKRRTTVKENNPDMSNTDVSRLLGEMWRNASATERAPYIEQEEQERSKYKEDIKRWRDEQTKSDSAIRVTYQAMPHAPESYAVHEPSLPDHDGVSIEPISFNQPGDSFSSSCSSVFRSQKAPIADATNRHHGGLRNYTERIVMKDSNLHAYGTSSQGSLVYGHRYRQPYYEPVHQFRHQYTHGKLGPLIEFTVLHYAYTSDLSQVLRMVRANSITTNRLTLLVSTVDQVLSTSQIITIDNFT